MTDTPGAPRRLSAIDAAVEAVDITRRRLFPFRLEHWLVLGAAAFLDRCGRGGATSGIQLPGGGGGGGDDRGGADLFAGAGDWIAEHFVLIAAVVLFVLALVVAVMAVVLWINSRGVFIYLDAVATGRAEIARPWREHRDRAWSYFGWSFGLSLATLGGIVTLLVPAGWIVYLMVTGEPGCGSVIGLVVLGVVCVLFLLAMSLVSVLLRDFAAPLQVALDVPAGAALREAWRLARTYPAAFLAYLGLKIVFSIAFGVASLLAGCFTCCIGFLPVIAQTILQPLYYFERAWSLVLLRRAGFDLFPAEPVGATPPAPLPPPPPAGG